MNILVTSGLSFRNSVMTINGITTLSMKFIRPCDDLDIGCSCIHKHRSKCKSWRYYLCTISSFGIQLMKLNWLRLWKLNRQEWSWFRLLNAGFGSSRPVSNVIFVIGRQTCDTTSVWTNFNSVGLTVIPTSPIVAPEQSTILMFSTVLSVHKWE